MILADTNVLLRLVLQDDPKQSPAATAALNRLADKRQGIIVHELALAELAWILGGKGWTRPEIAEAMLEICADKRLVVRDTQVAETAAEIYSSSKVSFVDAWHAAFVQAHGLGGILSFDRDFDGLGVTRIEPN